MKKLSFLALWVFMGLGANVFAQVGDDPWEIGIALDMQDYYGPHMGKLSQFDTLYYFVPRFSFGRNINSSLKASANLGATSVRYYINDKFPDVGETKYLDLSALLAYKFNNGYILREDFPVAPYLFAGVSANYISNFKNLEPKEKPWGFDIPLGVGLNIGLIENSALQLQAGYNIGINDKTDNHMQYTAGFVFDFGGKRTKTEKPAFVPPPAPEPELDTDKDGIPDSRDECPNIFGTEAFNGCPDSDGDGIADIYDDCPSTYGPRSNNGCPEISEEVITTLEIAAQDIHFETNSDVLKSESFATLDKIAEIMDLYPDYNLSIEGHTDSQGSDELNLELSRKRAVAAANYLINKGVPADRLLTQGFGETRPIADNNTADGRALNRRVEFKLVR